MKKNWTATLIQKMPNSLGFNFCCEFLFLKKKNLKFQCEFVKSGTTDKKSLFTEAYCWSYYTVQRHNPAKYWYQNWTGQRDTQIKSSSFIQRSSTKIFTLSSVIWNILNMITNKTTQDYELHCEQIFIWIYMKSSDHVLQDFKSWLAKAKQGSLCDAIK